MERSGSLSATMSAAAKGTGNGMGKSMELEASIGFQAGYGGHADGDSWEDTFGGPSFGADMEPGRDGSRRPGRSRRPVHMGRPRIKDIHEVDRGHGRKRPVDSRSPSRSPPPRMWGESIPDH